MIFSLLHFRSVCFLSNYQLLLEQRLCHHLQTLLSCINPLHDAHCLYRERCVSYWQHRFIYICFFFFLVRLKQDHRGFIIILLFMIIRCFSPQLSCKVTRCSCGINPVHTQTLIPEIIAPRLPQHLLNLTNQKQ